MIKALFILFLLVPFLNGTEKPNILWIVVEDMSQDLGCYGNKAVTTPNLDRLAARGMLFKNMFTTGPACSPSRTGLASGVFQTSLGAYHMRYSEELKPLLKAPYKTLSQMMQSLGYFTGNIKNICETGTGKDDWLFKIKGPRWQTQKWSELVKNQPFFGQINSSESHRAFSHKSKIPVKKDLISIPPYYPDHPVSRDDWAGYLAEVNRADELVGNILAKLKEEGLADNTIVIFISDHGRPMTRGKNWLYDSGTQIPLIIYIPEKLKKPGLYKSGSENSQLLSAVDLVAETINLAGGEIPEWMQGRSFLNAGSKPREFVPTAVDRIGNVDSCSRAIRTDKYKYIRNFKQPGSVTSCATPYRMASHPIFHLLNIMNEKQLLNPVQKQLLNPIAEEELYDLEKDPFETENLIGKSDFESIHKEMKSILEKWISESGDKGFEKDSEEIVKYFHSYGVKTMKSRGKAIEKQRKAVQKFFE